MDGADARAGEHGVGGFGDHRQVDGDPVALLDALGLEHIGKAAHLGVELPVGDLLVLGRVVALPDDRHLVAALVEMAIDAVVGDVEGAVLEPFDRYVVGIVGGVLHARERLDPIDPASVLTPEAIRVLDGGRIHLLVLGVVHIGARLPVGRDLVNVIRHLASSTRGAFGRALSNRVNRGCFLSRHYASAAGGPTRRRLSHFRGRSGAA